jgi:hypothetical protein
MYMIFFLQDYLVFVGPRVLKDHLGSVSSVTMQAPTTYKL